MGSIVAYWRKIKSGLTNVTISTTIGRGRKGELWDTIGKSH